MLTVILLPNSASAAECTHSWSGGINGEWQVAGNWSPEEVPGPSDVACIPKEKTAQVVSGTQSVDVLQGEGRLTILAGSLALLGPESSHIKKLHLSGGALKGSGELLVTEFLNADGGSMEGAGKTVIGAEASGHVAALEESEGPGLRLTDKRELDTKGVLDVAGLGGQLNVIEGANLSVINTGELAVKGPEGRIALSESADLVNAKTLTVAGPAGQLVLSDHTTLLNSNALILEAASGGLISQDDASIENTGELTVKGSGGEIRTEGTSIDNSGTLAIEAGEGRIHGSDGAMLDNSGTLVVNGEGEGNGLVAGTGTQPKLTNTGTLVKDKGSKMAIIEFKVDNEELVEVKSGSLAFTGGGNSGQEHLNSWNANGEEAQIVFSEEDFTFGGKAAMGGLIMALDSADLKGHRFEAEEAELRLVESSFEVTDTEESRFDEIAVSAGTVNVIDGGLITMNDAFVESGSFEIGDDATANIGEIEQMEGTTIVGNGAELVSEAVYIDGGALQVDAAVEASIENFFQVAGSTAFGPEGVLISDGIYIEGGTFGMGASPTVSFVDFFQSQEEVETSTTIGGGGTFTGVDAFVDGGSFEFGGGAEAELELFFHERGTTTVGSGATLSTELGFIEEDFLTLSAGSQASFDELYHQEATITIEDAAEIAAEEGYLEEGVLDGSGTLAVSTLWWQQTQMTGTGSTIVDKAGMISSGESLAGIAERRLVTHGSFSMGESTLAMADGARLINEAEFDASSEASGFGAQIQIAESSTTNPRIVNKKEFNKESGSGTTEVTVPFENNGTIGQFSGTLSIKNRLGVPTSEKFGFRCYCADPVETASGNFTESQTDISVGGLGLGLSLTRTYSAQAAASATSPGSFGYGWSSSFSDRLIFEEEGKRITLERGDGSTVPFTADGEGGFDPPAWSQDTLSGSPGVGYIYVTASQIEREFATSGALQSVTDRNGNETTLAYNEAGRLKTITDPSERQIVLAYNGEGLVESAEDPMGHVTEYAYEGKDLASVTLPGDAEPRWQFEYDPSHRMTKMIDGRGGETLNEYDAQDRVILQTDPAERTITFEYDGFHTRFTNESTGAVTDQWFNSNNEPFLITRGYGTEDATTERFSYDDAGRLMSRTDGNGHTTTYTYNPAGDRTSVTDPEENETQWEYNSTHDVISETTPRGETTTIVRDADGNPEAVSRPAPGEATQTTEYQYDPQGQLESRTDPLERTWTYGYNSQGDLTSETNPEGGTQTWGYNENSQLIATVSPRGNAEGAEPSEFMTIVERDPQGRPEEVIDPLGNTTKYTYDANGNLETETNAKGSTTEFTYNPADELIKTKRPSGAILETKYNGAGEVIAQVDGNEEATTYVRNVLGQPIEIVDALERKTVQEFDDAGNLETVVDPAERTTTYSYDNADRLEAISYSDEVTPSVSFEYDPDDNLIAMSDGSGESSYVYDQLGRLEEATNGNGKAVAYEYNLGNEQERIVYPNGKNVDRTFDDVGRLESLTDWLGGTTSFVYDADSNLKAIEYPAESENIDEFAYDPNGRMLSATMKVGEEPLAGIAYGRDKLGQVETMASAGLPGPEEESYEYDEDNRLLQAGTEAFEYDPADNPIKTPGSINAFDDASQLESGTGQSYEYSPLGERTKTTPSSGPSKNYAYDQAGNLTSVKRAQEGEVGGINEAFAYDGLGLMMAHSIGESTRKLTWDRTSPLPLVLDDSQGSYIYGPGGLPIAQISKEEEPAYFHHDQLGSIRALTDSSGEAIATLTYNAYGGLKASTGSNPTSLGFAGQYTLPQSGLQYLRARTYDPETAQFLSRDPVDWMTRVPYLYADGNPLTFTDPSGLCSFGPFCSINPCAGPRPGALCELGQRVTNAAAGVIDELGAPIPSDLPGSDLNIGPRFREATGFFAGAEECSDEYDDARKATGAAKSLRTGKTVIDIFKKILVDGFPSL